MISIASDLILKQVDLGFRREEKAAVAERLQKCGALDKRSNE